MARSRIVQTDDRPGFHWEHEGRPIALADLVRLDDEPERLLPTHLEALDDALIIAAGSWGEILGGGRRPANDGERSALRELYRALDRLVHEYASAAEALGATVEVRAGQIVGTAALVSILARQPLGILGPAPLERELDAPGEGIVGGYGDLVMVDPARPWTGGRWVIRTTDGRRLPASLSILLHDSSGVNKDAALDEHRAALEATTSGAGQRGADPIAAASALDWMLYDWLAVHRAGPDSGEIEIRGTADRMAGDAAMIVAAAAVSVRCRAQVDPGLLRVPGSRPGR